MARVSQETIDKLTAFLDSLPAEARAKCSLCNDTLTHIVKTAEVETGAGTATVTRALAETINKDAAPQDRVSDGALHQRVLRAEGAIITKRNNNPPREKASKRYVEATESFYSLKATDQKRFIEEIIMPTIYPPAKVGSEWANLKGGADHYASMAIAQLERIEVDDPKREEALRKVIAWVQQQLDTDGVIDQEALPTDRPGGSPWAMLYIDDAIHKLGQVDSNDPARIEAVQKFLHWAGEQHPDAVGMVQEATPSEPLPPAKAERQEKALSVLKPLAKKAITAAIENGLDKALHLNDSFVAAYSTGAGAGRALVAEVTFKKMNGT